MTIFLFPNPNISINLSVIVILSKCTKWSAKYTSINKKIPRNYFCIQNNNKLIISIVKGNFMRVYAYNDV